MSPKTPLGSVRLGRTGPVVSRLGLGGCPLGGHGWGEVEDKESIAAVKEALARGVTFFDTADIYGLGHSETLLANALGPARHDVVLASKFGVRWDSQRNITKDASPDYARQACEASLRRLKVERIDLYYVHWPDGRTPVHSTIEALAKLQNEGKIGHIGVSNYSPDQLQQATSIADIVALQTQYSLVDRQLEARLLSTAVENGVSVVTWGSLAQGLLTGKFGPDFSFGDNDRRSRYDNFKPPKLAKNLGAVEALRDVSSQLRCSMAQVAMAWLLGRPGVGCVLFGAKRPVQVADNIGADAVVLSDRQRRTLDEAGAFARLPA